VSDWTLPFLWRRLPLRRLELLVRLSTPVTRRRLPLMRLARLSESYINGVSDRIGFFAPSMVLAVASPTYEVFAPLTVSGRSRKPETSSLSLSLLSRVSHTRACCRRSLTSTDNNLPCGSLPFDVFPVPGSHSFPGLPTPEYVPSQRFSRSQGLAPPGTCRPCFMPVPPLGFYPTGFVPPAEPHALSDAVALLRLVHSPVTTSPRRSRKALQK
jgi:hypothetical protein